MQDYKNYSKTELLLLLGRYHKILHGGNARVYLDRYSEILLELTTRANTLYSGRQRRNLLETIHNYAISNLDL